MNDDIAISVQDVSKRFRMRTRGLSLKTAAIDALKKGRREGNDFWALRDVNFEVKRGETLGLIGANGAGKSTLLSLLAETMYPTSGRIETRGTIGSLLELGAGFHPDLSGRENVFLAGAIMGIPREHMESRFESIVEFAELGDYIDQPVRHYSSGMYVRLGFAVSVEADPDILLVDEVLAVGDEVFQRKCVERMDSFRESGKTMLVISHDMATITQVSDRIMLLDQGQVMEQGAPSDVVQHYLSMSAARHRATLRREWGSREITIDKVDVSRIDGETVESFSWSDGIAIRAHYTSSARIEDVVFGYAMADDDGSILAGSNCMVEGDAFTLDAGTGVLTLTIPALNLSRGTYLLSLSVHSADHRVNYHRLDNCFPITINDETGFDRVYLPTRWDISTTEA